MTNCAGAAARLFDTRAAGSLPSRFSLPFSACYRGLDDHEGQAHFSTEPPSAEQDARFPRADGDQERQAGPQASSRQRTEAFDRLLVVTAAVPRQPCSSWRHSCGKIAGRFPQALRRCNTFALPEIPALETVTSAALTGSPERGGSAAVLNINRSSNAAAGCTPASLRSWSGRTAGRQPGWAWSRRGNSAARCRETAPNV